jgi:hypothetical protein
MLNLDRSSVTNWLISAHPVPPHAGPPPIRPVEDNPAVEKSLAQLGDALDAVVAANVEELAAALRTNPARAEMQAILAQLGAARLLRILHWLAEIDLPEARAALSALLEDGGDGAGAALRSAVEALIRSTRLAQIFDPERIAQLAAACEEALGEPAS